ncbi:hypothetical protein OG555_37135 [Kribbella sp. NBC_01484]|uniref:VOC family protein n=1 Tax=Kribbella sp. NBC_01484 TaxID=2903579 RepID=UPI002E303C7F|nr:VOC family protein [Kribbella sp. NBC_01484]
MASGNSASNWFQTTSSQSGLTARHSKSTSTSTLSALKGSMPPNDEVIGLGGRLLKAADDRTAARGVQTYADPAGHPFCVCWLPAD